MKTLATAAFLTLLAASAAQAAVKVEPRIFHSNLRLDAESIKIDNARTSDEIHENFLNSPGVGVAASFAASPVAEFGFGYSFARYHLGEGVSADQQIVSIFTRNHFVQSETGKIYALLGLSSHQFDEKYDSVSSGGFRSDVRTSYSPLLNYDIGLGGAITIGAMDLGMEYKYSNTVTAGTARYKARILGPGLVSSVKAKVEGVVAENQELSLTFGVRI